jgi:hypothetical protein
MTEKELAKLGKLSMYNRERLLQGNLCGCYYCGRVYTPGEIVEWTDKDLVTAICPHCGIDSVLDEANGGADLDVLEQMHQRSFLRGSNAKGELVQLTDRRVKKFNG